MVDVLFQDFWGKNLLLSGLQIVPHIKSCVMCTSAALDFVYLPKYLSRSKITDLTKMCLSDLIILAWKLLALRSVRCITLYFIKVNEELQVWGKVTTSIVCKVCYKK